MESENQASNIEVKECFVLPERIDLNKYNVSSDPVDLSNLSFLLSQGGSKSKYEKRNLPLSQFFSHFEKEPHECKVCGRRFKTLKSYKYHVKNHSRKRSHFCEECGASFYGRDKLHAHIRYRHTKEKPHRCSECDRAFVEMSKLKRHIQFCHSGERPYECPFCVYAAADKSNLKQHLLVHTGEKPYECDICQARFSQKRSLQMHNLIHSKMYPFPCDFCPASSFRYKKDLNEHIQRFHTENPVKCPRCEKILPDRYSYRLHSKTHAGEKWCKCDICPYVCNTPYYLKRHMYVHTGEKPFKCDECDKAYVVKQFLNRHKNVHHPKNSDSSPKEKRNPRSVLRGNTFHDKLHSKTHEGEKYKCDFCPYESNKPYSLKCHMYVHTGEKPFKCDECDKAYVLKQLLNRHKNVNHNPKHSDSSPKGKTNKASVRGKAFHHKLHSKTHAGEKWCKCDICPYVCNKPYFLKRHMYVHTGEKPFKCDECDKAYVIKQFLNRHKNVHHPKNSDSSPKEKRNPRSVLRGNTFHHKTMGLENPESDTKKDLLTEKIDEDMPANSSAFCRSFLQFNPNFCPSVQKIKSSFPKSFLSKSVTTASLQK